MRYLIPILFGLLPYPSGLRAEDLPVEKLAAEVKPSVVVVTIDGRGGGREGLGTGFVVGKGLIATNLHVVGQARPITIETAEGKKHEVLAVHASDRVNDLAILRIKDESLPVLPMGDSEKVREGQPIVALGNPHGLKHSVVSGVISGTRKIDERDMLQVAIPIERGNSGGPLLDREGHVLGIMTIKSLVTENLGFAVGVNALKPLLAKPNPVPMKAWLTIGVLDEEEWQPMLGADWRQRAGRITVSGTGSGFGGRSYCLWKGEIPKLPYEVGVTVKLDDESGAAGLIFRAKGERHYGFYPSGAGLRLTRFDGPNVFTWKILRNEASEHYRPGEWNRLKVRLEEKKFSCYVNDHLIFESEDDVYTSGQVGLTKFRTTEATFKHFRVGKEIASSAVPEAVRARVRKSLEMSESLENPPAKLIEELGKEGASGVATLRQQAKELEQRAEQLRQLAVTVHQQHVREELAKELQQGEEKIALVKAALWIAKLDNDELEMEAYLRQVERLAKRVRAKLPKKADEQAKLKALNEYLFEERGFHGSRSDYYNRSNSYLNEVLDDREGLPITLSLIYLELGQRLGLKMEGVGLPGHFVVRHVPAKGEPRLIDVFEAGKPLSRKEAEEKVRTTSGAKLTEEDLKAIGKRDLIVRMLHNLLNIAEAEEDFPSMRKYLDTIIAVRSDAPGERGMRALVRYRLGDRSGALADLDWILEKKPDGLDLDRVRELRRRMEGR